MQAHWEALAAVATTKGSCAAIAAIQAHIKTMEDDAAKARELIDLLIETCPESHEIIKNFAHNVIRARKA